VLSCYWQLVSGRTPVGFRQHCVECYGRCNTALTASLRPSIITCLKRGRVRVHVIGVAYCGLDKASEMQSENFYREIAFRHVTGE
jgi:hypothetical protein